MAITTPILALKTLFSRFPLARTIALFGTAGLAIAVVWGTIYFTEPAGHEADSKVTPPEVPAPRTVQQPLDQKGQLENELASKIVQILEPIVGQGKVRPQVSVSINVQQVEETTEQYDPESSVVRSE